MSLVFLETEDELDPKFGLSNTERRAERAMTVIPHFVAQLLSDGPPLTPRSVELLYREYRAYHRSRRPFRSCPYHIRLEDESYYSSWQSAALLERLQQPDQLNRHQAVQMLVVLHRRVESPLAFA